MKYAFLLMIILLLNVNLLAQKDSLDNAPKVKTHVKKGPLKATLLSAVVPGAGQIFNRKYWKAPIVWAIVGGAGYFMIKQNNTYQGWREAYLNKVDNDPNTIDLYPNDSKELLKQRRDAAQKQFELITVGFSIAYILNIADAFVDAHLRDFNVNDDLSLRVSPDIQYEPMNGLTSGMSFQFRLRAQKPKPTFQGF